MKTSSMKLFFNLSLALLLFNLCQAQQTDLALNLEAGKTYKQQIDTRSTINQEVEGQKVEMQLVNTSSISFHVKSLTNENFVLEVKYDKIEMSIGNLMEFSSETINEYDIFSSILTELVNNPFEITMTKRGRVSEIRNIESMFEKVMEKFAEVPEIELEQYQTQLKSAFGDAAFKTNIELFTAIYPESPVRKGDKWNISTGIESGMTAFVTSSYEFIDQTSSYVLITGNSTIDSDKSADIDAGGMTLNYDLTGIMTSEIKVDRQSGWIIEAKINQEMKGISSIKPNEFIPEGMTVPVSITTSITTKN